MRLHRRVACRELRVFELRAPGGAAAALLIGFVALMPVIGTFPALVLFLPALSLLWGERRWRLMALSFAGFAGFVYLLFRLIMNVPLP